jgi:hypothetical protein
MGAWLFIQWDGQRKNGELQPSISRPITLRFTFYILLVLVVMGVRPVVAASSAKAPSGPLRVRNQFAPHLMFLTPVPAEPAPLPQNDLELNLSLDYSSVFFAEHSDRWSVLVDMEMAVVDLGLRYGLTPRLTLSLSQPAARMSDGFLDGPLEAFHSAFGLPNYDKDTREKDDFAYFIRKDGRDWFRSEAGGWHLMDTTLGAEWGLLMGAPGDLSLLYQIQLPSGEEKSGFGSGSYDHSLQLPADFKLEPFRIFMTPGVHLPGEPETLAADIHTRPFASLLLGTAYAYDTDLSLVVQVNGYTSPLERTGIPKLDNGSLELGLGFNYHFDRNLTLEFAFTEDLTRAAPDFDLHLRLYLNLPKRHTSCCPSP